MNWKKVNWFWVFLWFTLCASFGLVMRAFFGSGLIVRIVAVTIMLLIYYFMIYKHHLLFKRDY
jgi:uncharacterized membrane protein